MRQIQHTDYRIFGCMMSQAHQAQEHVEIDRILDCIEGYTAVLCRLYGLDMSE